MKKISFFLFALAVVLGSCTKEYVNPNANYNITDTTGTGGNGGNGGNGGGGGGNTIGAVPSTFSKKAIVEEFTGTWCGYCPDGGYMLQQITDANPGRVYGASVHQGDPMEIGLFTSLDNDFTVTGFPTGMVDRFCNSGGNPVIDRNQWQSVANQELTKPTQCGLAMSSYILHDSIFVTVHAGFNSTLSGDYRVTVYLVEDDITGYPQHNYYDDGSLDPNSPFVGQGDPIPGYVHNHVVRKVMSADLGDVIAPEHLVVGGEQVSTYAAPITGYVQNNLHILAFVNLVGTTPDTHYILNAQEAAPYEVKNWD